MPGRRVLPDGILCKGEANTHICPRGARMTLALNLLWLICGGFLMGCAWLIAAVVMFISIIGIPWGRAAFNIAVYPFFPFGNEAISRYELTGREDIGTGPLGLVGNVIWFVLAGIWLAIAHLVVGIAC